MTVLKRVGVLSVAKVLGAWYALMGLVAGALFSLFSVLGAAIGMASGEGEAVWALLFGVGAIIIMPIFYGLLGVVFGALGALFYNLTAKIAGGIELELEQT